MGLESPSKHRPALADQHSQVMLKEHMVHWIFPYYATYRSWVKLYWLDLYFRQTKEGAEYD